MTKFNYTKIQLSKLLNEKEWSDKNFIIKSLGYLSKNAFESAKKKIPANDGEIYLLEYMYKIGNFIPLNKEKLLFLSRLTTELGNASLLALLIVSLSLLLIIQPDPIEFNPSMW